MIAGLDNTREKARKHGLNVSKVSENDLIDMISRIEGSSKKDEPASSVNASSQEGSWCGCRDLNPGWRIGNPPS